MIDKYTQIIEKNIDNCLTATNFKFSSKKSGKVRDIYDFSKYLAIITTDRQSAFDKHITNVPFKGQVLNLVSNWWFKLTSSIIPNHVISVSKPNLLIAKKCHIFPVEFIVRGYITGSSKTSLWTYYRDGARNYCGHQIPDNLKKNQKLPTPILTPTTKSDLGDELISKQEIIDRKLMTKKDFEFVEDISLKLFSFGQKVAQEKGFLLVDTKYEFGKDEKGNIILVDEIHTPDSSRYWLAKSYWDCFSHDLEPKQFDKEILRRYYAEKFDVKTLDKFPEPPKELIIKLASSYIEFYELLTSNSFIFEETSNTYLQSLEKEIDKCENGITDVAGF